MLTVVTGAAGFVGQALAARMEACGYPGTVRLVDRVPAASPSAAFDSVVADLTEPDALRAVLAGAGRVIHLASLPGGAAEAAPRQSRRINLDASLDLIEALQMAQTPARLVTASSIAVLGDTFAGAVDDETPPRPATTYGAHKLMVQIALADAARCGAVDGYALRLPGIVARPRGGEGLKSGFMSDVFHAVAAGEPYCAPVGPQATIRLLSAAACAQALIHAVSMAPPRRAPRAFTLPALRVGMGQLVAMIASIARRDVAMVSYAPDAKLEAQFGRLPALSTAAVDALGFVHDGDVATLVSRAIPTSDPIVRTGLDAGRRA